MGDKISVFTDLNAWKEGHKLVLLVYEETKRFPRDELFGITNQMRRCTVGITSNIAEGFSRQSYKEKVQFYSISLGCVTELQNQLIISKDLEYLKLSNFEDIFNQTIIVHKLINGLIRVSKINFHNS